MDDEAQVSEHPPTLFNKIVFVVKHARFFEWFVAATTITAAIAGVFREYAQASMFLGWALLALAWRIYDVSLMTMTYVREYHPANILNRSLIALQEMDGLDDLPNEQEYQNGMYL